MCKVCRVPLLGTGSTHAQVSSAHLQQCRGKGELHLHEDQAELQDLNIESIKYKKIANLSVNNQIYISTELPNINHPQDLQIVIQNKAYNQVYIQFIYCFMKTLKYRQVLHSSTYCHSNTIRGKGELNLKSIVNYKSPHIALSSSNQIIGQLQAPKYRQAPSSTIHFKFYISMQSFKFH